MARHRDSSVLVLHTQVFQLDFVEFDGLVLAALLFDSLHFEQGLLCFVVDFHLVVTAFKG